MPTHLLVSRRPAFPAPAHGDFDRLFESFWRGLAGASARVHTPPVDWTETDAELRIATELPGLDEGEIEVSLEDGVLTIRGERAEASEAPAPGLRRLERFRGRFQRSLRLPGEVDPDAVRAVYRNGILTVTLPKAPAPEVRSIPVTGPGNRQPGEGER